MMITSGRLDRRRKSRYRDADCAPFRESGDRLGETADAKTLFDETESKQNKNNAEKSGRKTGKKTLGDSKFKRQTDCRTTIV